MPGNNSEAANNAAQEIGKTFIQLKKLLEEIVAMRVESAKLELDMLSLYHTVCPEELEGLRGEQQNIEISENEEDQMMNNAGNTIM